MVARQPTRVDWPAARAFYIALDPRERSYDRVASEFGVSDTTVRKWGKREDWPTAAAEADRKAAEAAEKTAVRSRTERVQVALRFVDRALDKAVDQLDTDDLPLKASDVPHLMKLAELLLGEPTDRIAVAQLEPMLNAYDAALDALRGMVADTAAADLVVERLDEALLALAAASRERQPA